MVYVWCPVVFFRFSLSAILITYSILVKTSIYYAHHVQSANLRTLPAPQSPIQHIVRFTFCLSMHILIMSLDTIN